MLFMKRKTGEFHFTPEQEACLARCRELTNDELRILNGGGSYKGMPSYVQMQQGLSDDSSNNDSSSSSGTSKGHHGMPSEVEAMLEHSGSSSATETSSNAGQTTVISVTYPAQPATQPSAPKPTESTFAANHGTVSASGSGSTNHSSSSASSSTNNSSSSASTESGLSGNGSEPFPKPYAGAYEHGSYAEGQRADAEQGTQDEQAEQVPQADSSEVQHKGVRGFFKRMFGNGGKKTVHTFGATVGASCLPVGISIGAGWYINPRNDNLYELSQKLSRKKTPLRTLIGGILIACNIEELGMYGSAECGIAAGESLSFGCEQGRYSSIENMQGFSTSTGASYTCGPISGGFDEVYNLNGDSIGQTTSLCCGIGIPQIKLEAHHRWGATGTVELFGAS